MKATIKSIQLENFKGVKDKTFDFDNVPRIVTGRNASGKTTIATAYYWLFTDKDIDLNSNPDVKPLDVAECQPTVTVVMNIDGKEVKFCKSQKIKTSKPDENGIVKSSSTNTYSINDCPKSARDFEAYLKELQFPTADSFLIMSHTSVFSNMKNADMRKALFEMVSTHTDKSIAEKVGNIPELTAMLDNYKLEEVEAMQKASMKKCNEQLENIPSQIEGLELAKSDIDTSEQELLVKSLQEQIATERAKADEIRKEMSAYTNLCQTGLTLEFDRNTELQRMNDLANAGRKEIEDKINRSCNSLVDAKRHVNVVTSELKHYEGSLENSKQIFENLKIDFTNAKALTFDDSKTICPCCGQAYPEDKKAEIKEAFEKDKKSKMDSINKQAKAVQDDIKTWESKVTELKAELDKAKADLETLEAENKQLNYDLDNFKPTEVSPTEELKAIEQKIAENDKAKAEIKSHDNETRLAEINSTIANLQIQIDEANKIIGSASNNVRIDAQIEELQAKQIELEQTKADCEKILFQVELLAREKNNIVAEEINSYFDVVEFKLWELQKNGVIKDCCIPQYKGKSLGVATNSALEKLMQIDICTGFQKFNEVSMPIFIDQAELFSSDTYNSLECKTQHIYLKVTDDDLEVK